MNPPNKEEPPPITITNTSSEALLPRPNILLNQPVRPTPLQPAQVPNVPDWSANTPDTNIAMLQPQHLFDPSKYPSAIGNTPQYPPQLEQSPQASLYAEHQQPALLQSTRPSSMRLPAPSRDWAPVQQQAQSQLQGNLANIGNIANIGSIASIGLPASTSTRRQSATTSPTYLQQQQLPPQHQHQLLSPIPIPVPRRPRAIDIPVSRHQQPQAHSLSPIPSPTYPARMRPSALHPSHPNHPTSALRSPTSSLRAATASINTNMVSIAMNAPISHALPPLSQLLTGNTTAPATTIAIGGPSRIRGGVRKRALQHGCHLCPYRAHQSSDLKRHLATHQGLRPFRCPDCEHSFRQKAHLNAHRMAIHSRLKPHRCEVCSRTFAARSSLKRHVTYVHNKHPPFYCTHCPSMFQSVFELQRHQQVSHTNNSSNNSNINSSNINNSIANPARRDGHQAIQQHLAISPLQQQHNTLLSGNTNINVSPSQQLPLFQLQHFDTPLPPLSTSPPSPSFQHQQPQYQQQSQFHTFQQQQQQRRIPPLPLPTFFDQQRDLSTAQLPLPDDGNVPQPRVTRSPSLPIRPLMGGHNNNNGNNGNTGSGLLSRAPSLPYISRSTTRQQPHQSPHSLHRNILSRIRSAGTLPLPANLIPRQYQRRHGDNDNNENAKKDDDYDKNNQNRRHAKNGDDSTYN